MEHKHDHDCGHDHHGHDQGELDVQTLDPAGRSLADALRLSFRILSVGMIGVLIAFLCSGITGVDSQQVGVKKVFGKVVGASGDKGGLTYIWPYPIGELELVRVGERHMTVNDFWVFETSVSNGRTGSEGLRPGLDGALFTGDRNLLHARIDCTYKVQNAVEYLQKVAHTKAGDRVSTSKDADLEELLRSVLCNVALRVAASQTAESIWSDPGTFQSDVKRAAQDEVNAIFGTRDARETVALVNTTVKVDWPVRAQSAYDDAQRSRSEFETKRQDAIRDAHRILNSSAGQAYVELVGEPWAMENRVDETTADAVAKKWNALLNQAPMAAAPAALPQKNLIGDYAILRSRLSLAMENLRQATESKTSDPKELACLKAAVARYQAMSDLVLARIDDVLQSDRTRGQASAMLAQAKSEKGNYIESVKSRERRFQETLAEYNSAPQLMLERLWASTRDEILQSNLVEKLYITLDKDKTIVQINRDSRVVKEIRAAELAKPKDGGSK